MVIKIDIYYQDPRGNLHISHVSLKEDDLLEMAKKIADESRPIFLNEDWQIESASIDSVST